ncbi:MULTISPECIES: sarcosine oxidase subunit gamma [unclassified Sinorhizobium]|uniref:sarcosine oxidase subunit gamma n=1 Tax=unclassified Sinorhizobium TaxID=2613772 RepID=UPI0024C27021|nr:MULTISPECIES: sarcosine oxidase subunit gamma [unclassified Sinorhizobium]MDK1374060.1 sarcosine oxidase subunit gamma [Sinorhizobium sp. 6-70]MDK1480652.1 sarcosine oxidase subunit gamma [Sinorhizobium sp. 6-117]
MSEFRPTHRPALGTKQTVSSAALRLSPLPEGTIIHVLAQPGEQDVVSFLGRFTKSPAHAVRPVSPGQWFIVHDEPMPHQEMKSLFATLEPRATGVDQSHGRVRIRIEGKMASRALSKGTAIDLDPSVFPIGQSAVTLIGHIAAHITRVGSEAFEIIVLRGFAESLWDDLARMSLEFS